MKSAAWKRATTAGTAWGTGTDSMKYDKLVRDRIPEIIRATGKECHCRVLSDEEYLARIDQKLGEELAEYLDGHEMEELADLLEVIRAAAEARGMSMAQIEAIRAEKARKRGAFAGRILLTEVFDPKEKI